MLKIKGRKGESMSNNTVIASRVSDKYRKEVAEASRDKLKGNVVRYYKDLFAPLIKAQGSSRGGTLKVGTKAAVKKRAFKAVKKK